MVKDGVNTEKDIEKDIEKDGGFQEKLVQEIALIREKQKELEKENQKLKESLKENLSNKETTKKGFISAADLIALKNKAMESSSQISFETVEVINSTGNIVKYEVAKMKLSARGGSEVIQLMGVDFVVKHDNLFFDEIYSYYKNKYLNLSEKLPFSENVVEVLISRGILSVNTLKGISQSFLHNAITLRYPESVYRDVLLEVKDYLAS